MEEDNLKTILNKYQINASLKSVSYGTTGYRMKADKLNGISVRMAILGIMRSLYKDAGIGLMITASHNLGFDNGIKIIEPNGDMLSQEWENIAMEFVKWENNEFLEKIKEKMKVLKLSSKSFDNAFILIGYDTRKSSPTLAGIIIETLNCFKCQYMLFENVTTPQLHYFVKTFNESQLREKSSLINEYYRRFTNAFLQMQSGKLNQISINVDCANGVGSIHLKEVAKNISQNLTVFLHNTTDIDNLNFNCGADFVKINQKVPVIHNGDVSKLKNGERWCAVDGDADRLVYFYLDSNESFRLLDGDKIAVLIADYLGSLVTNIKDKFSMGIIQTAYANSASTHFIEKEIGVRTECVPTGVKHLHKAAKQFDIGIYFEANGHGTVLFSEKLCSFLNDPASQTEENIVELKRIVNIVNEADGDAITDMLLIELILSIRSWSLEKWDSLYTDYPNRQLKISVTDRSIFQTTDAERRLTSPKNIQDGIDKLINSAIQNDRHARAFVRPSGTEDIVRVYAEGSTQVEADELANQIKDLLISY